MNRDEARELLEIVSLLPPEDHTAEMREALALAERDPGLRAWLAEQKIFDSKIESTLAEIEPPAGLRSRLIRAMELEHQTRRRFTPGHWMALAAALALLVGASALFLNRNTSDWKTEALAIIAQVDAGKLPIDKSSDDVAALRNWLVSEKSPTASALPQGMSILEALGCKIVRIEGKPASIICYALPGTGKEAHLAVLQADSATASLPVFESRDGWQMVTWNENGRRLMLASRAPEAALRKMFI